MFYLGGMTLGYLAPPPPKATRQSRVEIASASVEKPDCEESGRNQEWARAFLTPWHLLY
ncbi:hypothetical protein PWG15_31360 (plasmid) [Ensifer adhaerens]|uniref:hypothetical protein n=1 Tax=Ensifer adhaerens TaxID=106592 RepID=UPI0023A9E4AA|nr:hypothetical protein [Ensifer adhaerens]WDZ79925.1 hypothetical protein PWG15_31360 [Ensifer adhaerens]